MILSVSRRTDIPAFYSEWFFNRLSEGFVLVRNPMNPHRVSRIALSSDVLDGIVFWTKDPSPMLPKLHKLGDIPFYFQFTLTSYGHDIESGVPSKNDVLVPLFKRMAKEIGRERLVWRYDPILITPVYTVKYHIKYFRALAEMLSGSTDQCTISFLDFYRNTEKRTAHLGAATPTDEQIHEHMSAFSEIASDCGIGIKTCAEEKDLSEYGITHASCIDKSRLERIAGHSFRLPKDRNQRPECGCHESIDIGAYNTCPHCCLYCYANYIPSAVSRNRAAHDPASPLLFGTLSPEDTLSDRAVSSCRIYP